MSNTVYSLHLSHRDTRRSISFLKKIVGCLPNQFFIQSHTSSYDAKRCPRKSFSNSLNFENRMRRDLGCREDVQQHRAVTHVPRGISCAIPVDANMKCCVRRKKHTCEDRFPVLLLLQQSKIALHKAVLLYLLTLLVLVEDMYL